MAVLVVGLIATAGAVIAADFTSGGDDRVARLTVLASLATVPALIVGVLRGYAAGLQRWAAVNAEKYIGAAVRLGGIGGLAVADSLTITSATLVIAIAPTLAATAYIRIVVRRVEPDQHPAGDPPRLLRRLLSYALRIWLGTLAGVLLSRVDQVLLTPLSGLAQLGLYVVAVNVSDVALIFNNAVRDVVFASQSRSTSRSEVGLQAARMSGLIAACVGGALAISLPFWVGFVFGEEFTAAIVPALVLIFAGVSGVPGSIAGAMLSAAGRPELRSYSMLAAAVVNVAALVALAPSYGAMGASLATLLGSVVASTGNLLHARRTMRLPIRQFYGVRRSDLSILKDALAAAVRKGSRKNV
jgi:O-antigen/teichoic acid export membrane protein